MRRSTSRRHARPACPSEPPMLGGNVIAATPGATAVRPTMPQPPAYPNVDSWDEKTYVCKPGDDFAAIAEPAYPGHGPEYAAALQMYNRNHPRAR